MANLSIQVKDGPHESQQSVPLTAESTFSYSGERARIVLKNRAIKVVNATSNADILSIDLSDPKNYRFKADLQNLPHVHPAKAPKVDKATPTAPATPKKRKTPPAAEEKGETALPKEKKARKDPAVVAAFNQLLEMAKKSKPTLELSE